MSNSKIDETVWDNKEHDWTGKSFYSIHFFSLFYNPIGLGGKLEQLNREARAGGCKIIGKMVLIEYSMFKGRAMIEIEKQDKYDANLLNFEDKTNVDTMVYRGTPNKKSESIRRLSERVASRRGMAPRMMFYMYVPSGSADSYKTILFAIT